MRPYAKFVHLQRIHEAFQKFLQRGLRTPSAKGDISRIWPLICQLKRPVECFNHKGPLVLVLSLMRGLPNREAVHWPGPILLPAPPCSRRPPGAHGSRRGAAALRADCGVAARHGCLGFKGLLELADEDALEIFMLFLLLGTGLHLVCFRFSFAEGRYTGGSGWSRTFSDLDRVGPRGSCIECPSVLHGWGLFEVRCILGSMVPVGLSPGVFLRRPPALDIAGNGVGHSGSP